MRNWLRTRARQLSELVEDPQEGRVVEGCAKGGARTKDLVARLRAGDIAVIDHRDIDRVAAESLAASGVRAVLNADDSSSGRYPNEGPLVLLDHDIVVIDQLGPDTLAYFEHDQMVEIEDDQVFLEDGVVLRGRRIDRAAIERQHDASMATLGSEFIRFIENTAGYFDQNRDLVSDDLEIPDVGISFADRHVLIVVRGHGYLEDLGVLRTSGYLAEHRPLSIGVDGGADALLGLGITPDVIVGDFDSVSDEACRSGAVLVVHGFPNGEVPGAARCDRLGVPYVVFRASGTSEDIAMLLAFEGGAELMVAVGTHTSMVDFLDKGRSGMASTILTRMKVGPILVDARGVSHLYKSRLRKRDLGLLVASTLVAMGTIVAVSEPVRLIIRALWSDLGGA